MVWNGYLAVLSAQLAEDRRRALDSLVDIGFGVGDAEALCHYADSQVPDATTQKLGVLLNRDLSLAGIQRVLARYYFQGQRSILDGPGHRPGMIEGGIDPADARIGHQAMGWLETHDAAPRCGNAYGPALVAADGDIDIVVIQRSPRTVNKGSAPFCAELVTSPLFSSLVLFMTYN